MRSRKLKIALRSFMAVLLVFIMIFPIVACNDKGNTNETQATTTVGNPENPENPENPGTPDNPEAPEEPGTPEEPEDEGPAYPFLDEDASIYDGTVPKSLGDVTWFDKNDIKTEYHINNARMLADLSYLVGTEGIKFDGVTFYLDCDIVWNDGIFTISNNGDPLFNGKAVDANVKVWDPIGKNDAAPSNTYTEANGFTNQFHGNFDGQGHKISGLYTNDREKMSGLFTVFYGEYIKNLTIINSYIGGDSRTGSFFGGCYATEDWGAAKDKVSVTFENLFSDAYVVTDFDGNSRSGGIGGMLRPLSDTNAAKNGFSAEFNNCWFDGTVYSTTKLQYSGGLLGVAAYGDTGELGSKVVFNNCLVTANIYGTGSNTGLVLGNMYIGIAEFNNVVAVIEDTNVTAGSSGIVSTLEGSGKVTIKYNNVFYSVKGGLSGTSYNYNKTTAGTTGIIKGTAVSDSDLIAAASLSKPESIFSVYGNRVILKGFDYTLPEYTKGLEFKELSDGTYEVSVGKATDAVIVIPATYNGKAVTKIAANAFSGKTNVTNIYVPTSVTEIGVGAFKGCTGLNSIAYLGTKSNWGSISKAQGWSEGMNTLRTNCVDGTVSTAVFNGAALSEYTIVIPEKFLGSDYRVAIYLKKQLDTLYGTNLEIQTDAKDYGHEFLIGATKRTTATAPTGHNFSVSFKNGDLQLQAGSVYAYDALNDYVLETLFASFSSINACTDGFAYSENITSKLKDGQEYTTKRDGDMRIMFFNVWGNSTTNYGPRDQHQMLAAEIINAYKPDVAGFQEFNNHNRDDGWWSLDTLLEAYGYKEVDVSGYKNEVSGKYVTNDGTRATNNFTPIFYNPEKVTLVEGKYRSYDTKYNDYGSKSLTWAVFTDKASGNKFAVISTHFWYNRNDAGNKARDENARIVKEEAAAIVAKYPGIPVFAGGDLNCETDETAYGILTQEDGFTSIQATAPRTEDHKTYHTKFKSQYNKMFVAGNKNVGIDINKNNEESDSKWMADGYLGAWTMWDDHPGGTYEAETGTIGDGNDGAIDHALVYNATKSNIELKMFEIIASRMALLASDHCPIIFDFNFNK